MRQSLQVWPVCIAAGVSAVSGCGVQPMAPEPVRSTTSTADAPTAPPTALADNPDLPGDDLQRIDLASLLGSGAISAEHNAGWNNFPRKITDGDTGTFKTTNGADPVRLTLTFERPAVVKSVRLFVSGAPQYDWAVHAGSGGSSYRIQGAGPDRWTRIDLPEPMTVPSLVVEMHRPGSDHTMSVHEIELYGPR